MNKFNIESVYRPKWPAFVVTGGTVTREQAMEVIVRTMDLPLHTNDHEFETGLYGALGVKGETNSNGWWVPDYASVDRVRGEIGIVQRKGREEWDCQGLEYCGNSRVVSSWVGGPHGWIDWAGWIGCCNYNIGKHPTAVEVRQEWVAIAEAFPFLSLKCQLFSGECCEHGIVPVVQYNVSGGRVRVVEPKAAIRGPEDLTESAISGIFDPGRERGCSLETFRDAVGLVREKVGMVGRIVDELVPDYEDEG